MLSELLLVLRLLIKLIGMLALVIAIVLLPVFGIIQFVLLVKEVFRDEE